MVMENEIRLGDIMDKLTPSDRVVIYMETYRATEQMWDWEKTDSLPEQVPVEQFTQYRVEDLQHILYIRIELKSEFER